MKGVALLLVAIAAIAGLCSGVAGEAAPAMSYQGGYSCGGKIAKLDCYAPDGVIKGIVYHNTNDAEATAICDYPFVNGGPDWTDNALVLDADESIIAVEACRGGYYGYSKLTVTTDKGRTWSCGGGSSSYPYKPPAWNGCGSWGSYKSYGCYKPYDYSTKYNKWSSQLKKYGTRGLLAAEIESPEGHQSQVAENAEGTYFKRNWGWGWNGGMCQTYRSPRQPKWSTCGGSKCNSWWSGKSKRYGSYGYVSNSYMFNSWRYSNSFYRYTWGGKTNIYYHNRNLYNKYNSYCQTNRCNYVPKCYYDENFPLASFSGICDRQGYVYNLYGFCWNEKYTPPTPPSALIVEIIFESKSGQPCVNIDGSPIDINAVLGQMKRYIDLAQPGLLKEITYYSTGYKCTPAGGGNNATAVVAIGLVPGEGKTVADILAYFQSIPILPGTTDLCSFPPIPDPATETEITPCVGELDSAIVASYDGQAVVSKKKKVTVKDAVMNIQNKYQYAKSANRFNNRRAKRVDSKYWSRSWPKAGYAARYLAEFPLGYKKNMAKYYGKSWKQLVKKTYTKKGL